MELTSLQRCFVIIAFSIVGIFSILQQQSLFPHPDVSWMTYAASLLLDGGTYSKNFFEIAPPTNLLLYTPAVLISNFFSIPIVIATRIYIYLLGTISLIFCYLFIKKIFAKEHANLALAFFICLEITFFVIPIYDFGQKEHLFYMLVMPYILLMVCRAQGTQINNSFAALAGIFSGLGLAIKPYFLIFPALLEIYHYFAHKKLLLKSNKWKLLIRPEICAILSVLFIYAVIIPVYFRDYLTVIVPYALRWNYAGMAAPLEALFRYKKVVFCLLVCLLYLIQYKNNPYKHLSSVLAITVIAAVISYIAQRSVFPYHWYPAYSFNLLLATLLLGLYIASPRSERPGYIWMGLLALALIICLNRFLYYIPAVSIIFPVYFLGFFTFLAFFMLYFSSANLSILILAPFIILFGGLLIKHLAISTTHHTILIVMFFLTSVFILLSCNTRIKSTHFIVCTLLAILFFAFPFYDRVILYQTRLKFDKGYSDLIAFTDKHALHKSIYFLSTGFEHFPIVDFCKDTKTAMRMPFFWMLPAMLKQKTPSDHYIQDKHFLTQLVAEDLRNKKPYLVFVDVSASKPFLYAYHAKKFIDFNFLTYFLTDNDFKSEWTHYRYFTSVSINSGTKQFSVYHRDDEEDNNHAK